MEAYIAKKQHEKLLKTYILRLSYQLTRGLEKEIASSLASSCIIIRRDKMKNQTEFGYKEELKTGALKKIHFVYLPNLSDLISFLWAHSQTQKSMIAGIFIDSIEQYFGQRFDFSENGKNIGICFNLLQILSQKCISSTKKVNMKIGLSFCYNEYIFPHQNFHNFLRSFNITVWQINPRQFTKNRQNYESQSTNKFLELYGGDSGLIKQQE